MVDWEDMADKPPENPGLEYAMTAVATKDTPENRRRLYEELIKAVLLVPAHSAPSRTGWRTTERETSLDVVIAKDAKGQSTLAAFTHVDALRQWLPKGGAFVGLPAKDLFRVAIDLKVASMSINPAGPIGGQLLPGELRALAEGQIPEGEGAFIETITIGKLGIVSYKAPGASPSADMVARLRDRAGVYPEIRRAYLFCADMGDGRDHYVVGIEFSRLMTADQAKGVFRDLGGAIGPLMRTNEMVDFMDLRAMGLLKEIAQLVPALFVGA